MNGMLKPNHCYCMDAATGLKELEAGSVNCCVTSPPYFGLRDYGIPPLSWPMVSYTPMIGMPAILLPEWTGSLGLEPTPTLFIGHMVFLFREIRRVMRDDGTLWINMGESYVGTGGDRKKAVSRYIFDVQQSRQPKNGRYQKLQELKKDGLQSKNMIGIPWLLAFALQADGWYLRQDIIWHKSNPMPESVTDRCTKSHEYIFLLSKSSHYYFNAGAIREPCVQNEVANGFRGGAYCNNKTFNNSVGGNRKYQGNLKPKRYGGKKYTENPDAFFRTKSGSIYKFTGTRNKRDVWTVATARCKEAHFATYPPELIKPCILAGCPEGGTVLDPFMGSGTTLVTANKLNRNCIGFDINLDYCNLANDHAERATAQQSFFRNVI